MIKHLKLTICILMFTLVFTTVQAAPGCWQFLIAPYGWVSGIDGTVSIRDFSKEIDISPWEFLKLFTRHGDFAGEVHLEARKDEWTFMLDPSYLKLSATKQAKLLPGEIGAGLEFALVDFAAFYQITHLHYSDECANDIQLLLGGRYFELDSTLTLPSPLPSLETREHSISPIIGARWLVAITPRWGLRLRGDIGGFGVDHMRHTWSASLVASYQLNCHVSLAGGFRALKIDYTKSDFKMDTTYYGPLIGVAFRF